MDYDRRMGLSRQRLFLFRKKHISFYENIEWSDFMSAIKRMMEEIYYEYEDGETIEELSSKWETEPDEIIGAIEIMKETLATKES